MTFSSFSPITPSLMNKGSIDWNLVETIDPVSLRTPEGISSMKILVQQFLQATTVPLENPGLILKLLQILQVIIGYLITSQDKSTELLKKKTLENQKLKKQIEESNSKNVIVATQCPICNKLFESLPFLDKHIKNSHQNIFQTWLDIRDPNSINLLQTQQSKQASNTEPDELQKTLKMIHKELRHKHRHEHQHQRKKLENRLSDFETQLQKLKNTISDPPSKPTSQTPPQILVQTLPNPIHTEIPTTYAPYQTIRNFSSYQSLQQPDSSSNPSQLSKKVEQATSPFPANREISKKIADSESTYNTNYYSDDIALPYIAKAKNDMKINQQTIVKETHKKPQANNQNQNREVRNQNVDETQKKSDPAKKRIKKRVKLNQNSENPKTETKQDQKINMNNAQPISNQQEQSAQPAINKPNNLTVKILPESYSEDEFVVSNTQSNIPIITQNVIPRNENVVFNYNDESYSDGSLPEIKKPQPQVVNNRNNSQKEEKVNKLNHLTIQPPLSTKTFSNKQNPQPVPSPSTPNTSLTSFSSDGGSLCHQNKSLLHDLSTEYD